MMITIIIYFFIILYIIGKGFNIYISIFKTTSYNVQQRESLQNSINLIALPFYLNQGKIHLFSFFINFLLISFISLSLLPDFFFNYIAYCQDNEDSDSSIDSDYGKSVLYYDNENNIYEINKNREEEIRREEEARIGQIGNLLEHILNYYPNEYEGLYKKTVEETYKISNYRYPYIYILNSFSKNDLNQNIEINNYLKVFQGFSKDLENFMEKQNNLIQKISFIDKHSFSTNRIIDLFSEISERSIDTLVLTSFAYDNLMDSFNKDKNMEYNISNSNEHKLYKPYYFFKFENSNEYKFFNKIMNEKTNGAIEINNNIKSFIGDHQVNNLNFKILKTFNSLEIFNKISKKNFNNLNELKFIEYTEILKEINNNQFKTFEELYNYHKKFNDKNSNEFSSINWNKIKTIHWNIYDFYRSKVFIKNSYQIKNTGFILKNVNELNTNFHENVFQFESETLSDNDDYFF